MRILLVQVPTSHMGAGEKVYPLGLARLSSLISENHTKWALDMNLFPDPWPELKKVLLNIQPDIAALSFRNIDPLAGHQASYISSLKTSAAMVRKLVPKARLWVGGPAFSLFGKRLMELIPEIDLGIVGEGESVFSKLISDPFNFENIPGLIWRKNDCIRFNPAGRLISMNCLPEIDTGSFDPGLYLKTNQYVASIGIEGKRGCDLQCGYCVYPSIGGKKTRLRSPKKIVDEMEHLKNEYSAKLFHFTDSVVNRPADHFEALCLEIINRKLRVGWTGFFREENITEKMVDLAVKAGLSAIYFSGDALTEHGLKILNKKMTLDDIIRAAKITAKNGILTMCHFLINLPGETRAHADESKAMLAGLLDIHYSSANLGAVIFNNVRIYPGAPLTGKLIRSGILDAEIDLLYPVYFNPPERSYLLHKLEAMCHSAGIFSRLEINL